jgi:hypothetical protein
MSSEAAEDPAVMSLARDLSPFSDTPVGHVVDAEGAVVAAGQTEIDRGDADHAPCL